MQIVSDAMETSIKASSNFDQKAHAFIISLSSSVKPMQWKPALASLNFDQKALIIRVKLTFGKFKSPKFIWCSPP